MRSCWRCYPKFCDCPLSADEIEQIKGDLFVAVEELEKLYRLINSILEHVDMSEEKMERRSKELKELIEKIKYCADNRVFK